MALKTNYEFLFVGRDEGTFLENYSYDLEEDGKGGQLFVTVEVQNNPADAEEIGNGIYDTMRKHFFVESGDDPYDKFEKSLKEVNEFLVDLKGEKLSEYIGNLNVLIGVIVGSQLHLTQTGDAEAYLVRKNFVTVVSEGLAEDGKDIFTNIASGTVEPGDFVVFSSARLLRYISKTDLAKVLKPDNTADSLGELKELIATEILGKVGLIGMTFEREREVIEEAVSSVETSVEEALSGHPRRLKFPKIPSVNLKLPKFNFGILDKLTDLLGGRGKSFFSGGLTKDKILGILIVVILVLIFGIWYAKNSAAKNAEIEALDATLNQVREQVTVAETKGRYDKKAAGIILSKAEESALKVLNSGYHRAKANEVLSLIQDTKDNIDNVRRIENPKVYADLTTKRPNVNALGMLTLRDQMYVFEYNALYELILDKIEDPVTLDDKETVIYATDFEDQDSLLFMTKSGKIIQYKDGNVAFMDSSEGQFHTGVEMTDWGNRIYVLDPENNQIWRYPYSSTRDIFAAAEDYNVDAELKDAKSFAIDASIYVLDKEGGIQKLYGGKKEDFVVSRQPFVEFDMPAKLYTDGEYNQVLVLDSALKRIFVYVKDLKTGNIMYTGQLVFPTLPGLRDMYVDKDVNKLYLLDSQKVYEIEL
ncbi:MAG: hypothetical protein ABH856_04980 [Patescibacteria group bacterium]